MTTPILFREVAALLAANGYRPVPIIPGTKKPGPEDWPNYVYAPGGESDYPRYGTGVLTGEEVVAVDIDVDDADAVAAIENLVYEILGLGEAANIPRRIGCAPRLLLPLRTSGAPFGKMTSAWFRMRSSPEAKKPSRVEVLATGQQFVAFAIHKDTHRPYEWNGAGSILTVRREDLPPITALQARRIVNESEAILEEWGERTLQPKEEGASHRRAELAAPLLAKLGEVRQTTKGWVACCPAHDDGEPSLSVRELDDRVLVHCHAGCTPEAIVRAVGLTMGALYRRPDTKTPKATVERESVKIGGALTLALGMEDLEFVASPILTKGQKGTLTAHPGHGKSTFGAGLAAAFCLRRPFGPIIPEAEGLAYFVSVEDIYGTRNKFLAESTRLRLDAGERMRLDARLRWVQVDPAATAHSIKEAIEADAAGQEVALVFVDTGPALFAGDDENDNIALRNFVEGFAVMAELPGNPATVLAWHPAKSAGADRLEPRGASAIKAVCDFCLTLWKEDDRVSLGYTKVRAQHFDPIDGRVSTVELIAASGKHYFAPVITLDTPDTEERAERSDAGRVREAILVKMYATRANPASVRDLATTAGISRTAAGRHLQHLATARPAALVAKDAVDDRYTLTKSGEVRAKSLFEHEKNAYSSRRE